jgi:membrane-associated phospholipid phosphatase
MMTNAAAAAVDRCAQPAGKRPAAWAPVVFLAALTFAGTAPAQERASADATTQAVAPAAAAPDPIDPSLVSDIKAYFTAPLRWNGADWVWFGGSLLAIGASHHYDTQVRTHFIEKEGPNVGANSEDLQDAIPTVAVLGATWLYAGLTDSSAGRREAWEMVEAAGLSGVTAYALKFAAGRETPYQTSDPNEWGKGGGSFPSLHATAAFAVGTVLAESGNDEYRWLRRVLGYGLGAVTSYERLKHNAHWLSDTVAGAALGSASARFTMNRHSGASGDGGGLSLVPIPGGALLVYRRSLD